MANPEFRDFCNGQKEGGGRDPPPRGATMAPVQRKKRASAQNEQEGVGVRVSSRAYVSFEGQDRGQGALEAPRRFSAQGKAPEGAPGIETREARACSVAT